MEIHNFQGDQMEVLLLVNLINYAASTIQKITVQRKGRIYRGDGEWLNVPRLSKITRKGVRNMLHSKVPLTTKLMVM